MSGVALSGLASGVDTDGIVTQLMAIERQKVTKMGWREGAVKARDTNLTGVRTRLETLRNAARDLASASLWQETQSASSTDAARVTGTVTGTVTPGEFTVTVGNLATIERRAFAFTADPLLPQTLSLTRSGQPAVNITLAAGATVSDAAAAINQRAESPVSAAVIDGKLQLTSKVSGAPGAFTASSMSAAATENLAEDAAKRRVGVDASYTVDGVAKTSSSNVAEGALPGLRLNLLSVTSAGTPVKLTVSDAKRKTDEIKAEVKAFVDAYNALSTFVREKTTEKKVASPTTATEAARGQLFGDRALGGLLTSLRTETSTAFAGAPAALDVLAELGISTGRSTGATPSEDALAGKLTIDDAKLTAALETDPVGVQRLLGGLTGARGLAQRIEDVAESQLKTDGGILPARAKASSSELTRLRDQITATERRLTDREKRLRSQFAAMETALSLAQTQQSWLAGQISSLG